jgi:hypothetical protein
MYQRHIRPGQLDSEIPVEERSTDGDGIGLRDLNSIYEHRSNQSGSPSRTPTERPSTGTEEQNGNGPVQTVDPAASAESLTPREIPIVHTDVGYDEARLVQ